MNETHQMRVAGAGAAIAALGIALAIPASAQAAEPPPGMPVFGYQGEITVPSEMHYNPTDEYIFPNIFHAGAHFDDPLGEWYLYTAPHDAPGGVILLYADSLEGPWTEYTGNGDEPLIGNSWGGHYNVSHVSSADTIWHEDTEQMYMYFHGENSTTRWATSTDGINFTYGGVAFTNSSASSITTESSYGRVFEHPDSASPFQYGMFYMANETDNRRKIRLAESVDGEAWTVAPDYVVEPGEAEGTNVSSANLWEWNGQLYVIYHASSGKIHARTIDDSLRDVGEESFILHESSGIGDDRGRTAAPEIVTHGGDTYLFFEGGHRLGATIRWAKAGADVVVPPPFGGFPVDVGNPVFEQCAAPGTDEFEGGALAEEVWDRVVREDLAEHVVTDGALVIPTYSGGVSAAPLLQQEIPDGPWEVTTKLALNPQQSFQQAGLLLYNSDTRYAKFDLVRATDGRRVELVHVSASGTSTQQTPPAVYQDDIWLRLTSDGTVIRAAVSYDGVDFERYGSEITAASAGFTHVGPFAFRGGAATPQIDATFDWFRFSPDAETYAECMDDGVELETEALANALEAARGLDTQGFTPESVATLSGAIDAAEAVLGDPQDQAQIDSALQALEMAVAGLELTPTPTPEPTPPPEPTLPPEPTAPPVGTDVEPAITVDTTVVRPGDEVSVTVTDVPGEHVEIGIASEYRALATVDSVNGVGTATVVIPHDITPGTHHLQARDADGAVLAQVAITVLGVDDELSATGPGDVVVPLSVAALLLIAGAGVIALKRRTN